MDLRQLAYFVEIAACGGINKAAARLHIAQSALSRHIQQLEHELGVPLLERSVRGIQLTAPGALLQDRARELLLLADTLREDVRAEGGEVGGPVAIGIPGILREHLAAPLLRELSDRHPSLQVTIATAMSRDIREGIVGGRLDLGVIGALEADDALNADPIARDDLLVVGAPGSPVEGRGVFAPAEVARLPLVVLSREVLRSLFGLLNAEVDISYGKVLEVSDGPLQLEMVLAGRYCSILPRVMVQPYLDRGDLCAAKLPGAFYYWRLARAADRALSAPARLAHQLLASCAAARLNPKPAPPLACADRMTRWG